jgi:hypothetical protein
MHGLKKNASLFLGALVGHLMPITSSCDDTLWIKVGFSADQYLLFLVQIFPKMK